MIIALAALATTSLPFAPPAAPLHYRTTRERAGPGGATLHFTMRKTIRYQLTLPTGTGTRETTTITLASDTGMLVARRRVSQFALPDRTAEIAKETRRVP